MTEQLELNLPIPASARNIVLWFQQYPPSTNNLYTIARGRKILSHFARAYKKYVKFSIAEQMPAAINPHGKFRFHYILYDKWTNKGWPKTKTRYRRFDISNRLKCLEDAICESFAIDDSQIFQIEIEKRENAEKKGIEVRIVEI